MKKLLASLFALAALGASFAPTAQAQDATVKVLTRAEIDQWLAKPEQVVFIDLRRPDELTANGGFPVFLSIQNDELERRLAWIPKDRGVITVSNRSGRSQRAAALLAGHGFNVVGAAGARSYEEEGGTLTKIAAPPPAAAAPTAVAAAAAPAVAAAAAAPETVANGIPGVVAAGTTIEHLGDGFQGTEGPIALPDGGFVFTETQANRITRIAEDGSVSTFLDDTNGSNGLAFTADGDLVTVQTVEPRVGVIHPAERVRVLADGYQGVPLNRPNDLVVDRRSGVYFTDPGVRPPPGEAAKPTAVYYVAPDGSITLIANDIERPNGIQLSPDEKVLYVANTDGDYVLAYDVAEDGTVGTRRNFAKLAGVRTTDTGVLSGADGLAIDADGRLYVATTAGIQVFDAAGTALGVIALPKAPQNLAFAGADKRTLYVVGRGSVYRVATLAQGFAGRAK